MRWWILALATVGVLMVAGCRAGGPRMAHGGAIADDQPPSVPGATEPSPTRARHAPDDRMTAPSGPVEHLPPGGRPADGEAPAGAAPQSPPVVPQAALSGAVPLYPGLEPLDAATVARETENQERVSQTFETGDPYATVVEWYARQLGGGWAKKPVPTLGSRSLLTLFERAEAGGASSSVQIAGSEGRVRVTVNESRTAG